MLLQRASVPDSRLQSCGAPAGMDAQLCAARGGARGGLAALSALERGPFQRIALQALPSQGGFIGLYHGMPHSPFTHSPPYMRGRSPGLRHDCPGLCGTPEPDVLGALRK